MLSNTLHSGHYANPGWVLKYLNGAAPQEVYDDDNYVIYYHSA